MAPLALRPQTQITCQSQSISPVKAQMYKIQQKIELAEKYNLKGSQVETKFSEQKKKY
jgi:hypothetical protein